MRSLSIALCMAAGLALSGASDAVAQNRSAPKNATIVTSNMSTASNANASSRQDSGQFERKCVIMSCGTPWCFNTRR